MTKRDKDATDGMKEKDSKDATKQRLLSLKQDSSPAAVSLLMFLASSVALMLLWYRVTSPALPDPSVLVQPVQQQNILVASPACRQQDMGALRQRFVDYPPLYSRITPNASSLVPPDVRDFVAQLPLDELAAVFDTLHKLFEDGKNIVVDTWVSITGVTFAGLSVSAADKIPSESLMTVKCADSTLCDCINTDGQCVDAEGNPQPSSEWDQANHHILVLGRACDANAAVIRASAPDDSPVSKSILAFPTSESLAAAAAILRRPGWCGKEETRPAAQCDADSVLAWLQQPVFLQVNDTALRLRTDSVGPSEQLHNAVKSLETALARHNSHLSHSVSSALAELGLPWRAVTTTALPSHSQFRRHFGHFTTRGRALAVVLDHSDRPNIVVDAASQTISVPVHLVGESNDDEQGWSNLQSSLAGAVAVLILNQFGFDQSLIDALESHSLQAARELLAVYFRVAARNLFVELSSAPEHGNRISFSDEAIQAFEDAAQHLDCISVSECALAFATLDEIAKDPSQTQTQFPSDQKYALYVPFFLPTAMSLIGLFKHFFKNFWGNSSD